MEYNTSEENIIKMMQFHPFKTNVQGDNKVTRCKCAILSEHVIKSNSENM